MGTEQSSHARLRGSHTAKALYDKKATRYIVTLILDGRHIGSFDSHCLWRSCGFHVVWLHEAAALSLRAWASTHLNLAPFSPGFAGEKGWG